MMIDIKCPRLGTDSQPGVHEEDPGALTKSYILLLIMN